MTDLDTLLESITEQDTENPVIADLVRQMYDPSEYSDAVEQAAAEQVNECLMRMVEEEKARQRASCCQSPESDELAGVDGDTHLAEKPKCDFFNSDSTMEIQKDKQVAVCDFSPADAGQKGRGLLDSKEVAGAGAGETGSTQPDGKQVASSDTAPIASVRAIKGDIVWMQAQLWDNSDRTRSVKYYSKYAIKVRKSETRYITRTLYLNFTSRRSFVKNYKTIIKDRHEEGQPVEQFYDKWRKRSIDEQKVAGASRPPLIGIAMSGPDSLGSIVRDRDGKDKPRLRVPTKNGKEIRNDYWPGHVGMLFWDECDNPHIWLGIYGQGEWIFSLIDGKHAGDWEPKTERQRQHDYRPSDFIGYWDQKKAEQDLLLEEVRRKRRR